MFRMTIIAMKPSVIMYMVVTLENAQAMPMNRGYINTQILENLRPNRISAWIWPKKPAEMIVENTNMNTVMATKMAPKLPNTDWKAARASWPELRPSWVHTPEARTARAVMVQITMVSMKTSKIPNWA